MGAPGPDNCEYDVASNACTSRGPCIAAGARHASAIGKMRSANGQPAPGEVGCNRQHTVTIQYNRRTHLNRGKRPSRKLSRRYCYPSRITQPAATSYPTTNVGAPRGRSPRAAPPQSPHWSPHLQKTCQALRLARSPKLRLARVVRLAPHDEAPDRDQRLYGTHQ